MSSNDLTLHEDVEKPEPEGWGAYAHAWPEYVEPVLDDDGFLVNTDDFQFVVVTTYHKGVFAGYIPNVLEATLQPYIWLYNSQNVLYWDEDMRGYLGLAGDGPDAKCKVSRPAPGTGLKNITSVVLCSKRAEAAWKLCPFAEE
jgi:hypothetical protein